MVAITAAAGSANRGAYSAVGTYNLTPFGLESSAYSITYIGTPFTISSWRLSGFYNAVNMSGIVNTIRGGQAVPLKFEIFAVGVEKTTTDSALRFSATQTACTASAANAVEITNTGATSLRYDATGGQLIQNCARACAQMGGG